MTLTFAEKDVQPLHIRTLQEKKKTKKKKNHGNLGWVKS